MLIFRDANKQFELKGDLLKMLTKNKFNVDLDSIPDKKLRYDFAREMHFDVRGGCSKYTRDKMLIKLLKSQGLTISASGIPHKIFYII